MRETFKTAHLKISSAEVWYKSKHLFDPIKWYHSEWKMVRLLKISKFLGHVISYETTHGIVCTWFVGVHRLGSRWSLFKINYIHLFLSHKWRNCGVYYYN